MIRTGCWVGEAGESFLPQCDNIGVAQNDLEAKRITTNQFCAIWSRLARFMAGRGGGGEASNLAQKLRIFNQPPPPSKMLNLEVGKHPITYIGVCCANTPKEGTSRLRLPLA